MSLKTFDDDRAFTHTLEAILGVTLILGTVIFVTGSLPYNAQKTGEHSKVQLMNIGRDLLDLIAITPTKEGAENSSNISVYRNYTLVADKKFVAPGETVNFTVYYLGKEGLPQGIVYKNLTLMQAILGRHTEISIGTIYGSATKQFSAGEYNIRAVEGDPGSPITWSNYVTIAVGYYYLDSNINGISANVNSSKIVDGVVYDSTGLGIPNLTIQILDADFKPVTSVNPIANTTKGTIIEDFENASDWTPDKSNRILNLSDINTSGRHSISLNGTTSSFWIKINRSTAYNLSYYDIVSFDFFARTAGERIDVELSDSSTLDKFIWKKINISDKGWNKINIKLVNPADMALMGNLCCHPKYPDKVEGNITAESVNMINITASNVSDEDYFIDNLTAGNGNFSFYWAGNAIEKSGTYYMQANDTAGRTSNTHRIIYSNKEALIYSERDIIYETETTKITLEPPSKGSPNNFIPDSEFNINQIFYKDAGKNSVNNSIVNKINITFIDPICNLPGGKPKGSCTVVNFTAYTAGDYYIFYGNTGMGNNNDPAAAAKTNTILIRVLPFSNSGTVGEDLCNLNSEELNQYIRRYMPPYVNYNLYLIDPDGSICQDCPDFKPVINGYPTDEAVTVNKILHLKRRINNGFLKELRMVLWYK